VQVSASITLRDVAGNPISNSGADFSQSFTVSTTPAGVLANKLITRATSAVYTLSWRSLVVGEFSLGILVNGTHIQGSPFQKLRVVASGQEKVPQTAYTSAEGKAVDAGAVAGVPTELIIVPRSDGGRAVTDAR
jgi:hypothetical protein